MHFKKMVFKLTQVCIVFTIFLMMSSRNTNTEAAFVNITIKQGMMRGKQLHTLLDRKKYFAFFGVPYAKPPIDELRYRPPQMPSPWTDVFDATKVYHGVCPQTHLVLESKVFGTEDCLYLNIFTPNLPKKDIFNLKPLPVMVWIHGYAFSSSMGHLHGPDFFIENDIIVVTANYRLGPLGFLNLHNPAAYGNMGLKDIVFALHWIKNNIQSLGGDTSKVTIFGSDSGATMISLLLTSPSAHGLFSKAIIQSGSQFISGLFEKNPIEAAERLIANLKLIGKDYKKEFLFKANASEIVQASRNIYDSTEIRDIQRRIIPFGPTIEVRNPHIVINKKPKEMYRRQQIPNRMIPVIIGYNTQESIAEMHHLIANPNLLSSIDFSFQYLLPFSKRKLGYKTDMYNEIMEQIRYFYFQNKSISDKTLVNYLNYVSDLTVFAIYKNMEAHLNVTEAPLYMYRFAYEGNFNAFKATATKKKKSINGTSVGDEICYLFKCQPFVESYLELTTNVNYARDKQFIKTLVKLWSNFAKSGDPTPLGSELPNNVKWIPVTKHSINVLNIDRNFTIVQDPERKMLSFWKNLHEVYFKESADARPIDEL